ncbi:MAG: MBL fold metallo-hydrolase [Anaerolineae bacterium]|nr:MBL fold metallo-hydrolase [Anaerolineae bacterium]
MNATIIPIRLAVSNVFAVRAEKTIIVDSSNPGNGQRILDRLARHGIQPRDISLIFLTHGHMDHFGSAPELRQLTGAPIALHPGDADMVRAGRNLEMQPTGLQGRLLAPLFRQQIAPFEPDIWLDEGFDLSAYGVTGRIIATPGHSPGSVSLLLPDGNALVGDLLRGGHLGGALLPHQPEYAYFYDDFAQMQRSIHEFMRLKPRRLYVGHGGPLDSDAVTRRFNNQ